MNEFFSIPNDPDNTTFNSNNISNTPKDIADVSELDQLEAEMSNVAGLVVKYMKAFKSKGLSHKESLELATRWHDLYWEQHFYPNQTVWGIGTVVDDTDSGNLDGGEGNSWS